MSRRTKRRVISNDGTLYVGVDVHEKESQLAVFEKGGSLLMEERMPTKDLGASRRRVSLRMPVLPLQRRVRRRE
jgi:hypothetical protein